MAIITHYRDFSSCAHHAWLRRHLVRFLVKFNLPASDPACLFVTITEKVREPHLFAVRRRIELERHPVPVITAELSLLRVLDRDTAIEDQRLSIVQVTSVTTQVLGEQPA